VKILGSSGALPAYNRHPTSLIVNQNERLFMVDCGEGTQMRLADFDVKKGKINHIFISHLHGDHYFGLLGLVMSYTLLNRTSTLHLYGPPQLDDMLNMHIGPWRNEMPYKLEFHPTQALKVETLFEDDQLTVETILLDHRIPTTGFLFKEKLLPRKMIKEKIDLYNIPFIEIPKIKAGADYILENGEVIYNNELTTSPKAPKSFAYCSDTAFNPPMFQQIRDADLLYHEATFTEDQEEAAQKKYHSTTKQAALTAKEINAQKLIIGHFSAKYKDLNPLLQEAIEYFPNTHLAVEGTEFHV